MRRTVIQSQIDLSGPFFTRDPGATLRSNIQRMMAALAEEMEADVAGNVRSLQGSMPYSKGWTGDHIKGRVTSLSGKRWRATAVVSANTAGMSAKEAIRTKAAASSIERRWHPFRKATTAVRRSRALLADLAKGLE